jgi:hypothetical protein
MSSSACFAYLVFVMQLAVKRKKETKKGKKGKAKGRGN